MRTFWSSCSSRSATLGCESRSAAVSCCAAPDCAAPANPMMLITNATDP